MSYSFTDDNLRELFATIGKVESAQVIVDKFSSQSKGFGFVKMESEAEAQQAIKDLNGKEVGGRPIMVNTARPHEERPRNSFGDNQRKFNTGKNRPRY